MSRIRISTTVDGSLLASARKLASRSDAAMIDAALAALLAQHRAAEVDASYAAYDRVPVDEPDAWGDLDAFRASISRPATRRRRPAS